LGSTFGGSTSLGCSLSFDLGFSGSLTLSFSFGFSVGLVLSLPSVLSESGSFFGGTGGL